jgi:hypothetical protein
MPTKSVTNPITKCDLIMRLPFGPPEKVLHHMPVGSVGIPVTAYDTFNDPLVAAAFGETPPVDAGVSGDTPSRVHESNRDSHLFLNLIGTVTYFCSLRTFVFWTIAIWIACRIPFPIAQCPDYMPAIGIQQYHSRPCRRISARNRCLSLVSADKGLFQQTHCPYYP